MTTLGVLKLRRDHGIERLMREIGKAAREIDRLLRGGAWVSVGHRLEWIPPDAIRRAMEALP